MGAGSIPVTAKILRPKYKVVGTQARPIVFIYMLVKRKVKNGRITLLGRVYLFPEHVRKQIENEQVFVEDDGVIKEDLPKWGLYTTSRVCIKYPGRYDWFTYATLDEKD